MAVVSSLLYPHQILHVPSVCSLFYITDIRLTILVLYSLFMIDNYFNLVFMKLVAKVANCPWYCRKHRHCIPSSIVQPEQSFHVLEGQ